MTDRIGFIGLGSMGLPMTCVLAGHGVSMLVHDVDAAARQRAAAIDGVTVAGSVPEVANGVTTLFTCVPNNAIALRVYLDPGGIIEGAHDGLTTIDCSTVSPSVTRKIHGVLAAKGTAHVDASMLGSVPQAETGTLGLVVGGERAAFDRVHPLLDRLGRMVKYVGPSGSANQVKLIHQTIVAANAAVVAEALALCMASGTDLDAFYDVVCNGGGMAHSRYFEQRTPRMRDGDFSPLFMLDLMAKDAGLARDLAREVGMATPCLDRVLEVFAEAQQAGSGGEDFSAVARVYEAATGKQLADH